VSSFGFTWMAECVGDGSRSSLLRHGTVQLVMTAGAGTEEFIDAHGDGIADIAFGCDDPVRTCERAGAAGASLVDVELPHAGLAIPVYYLVANAEASSNLARYDGVRYGARAANDTLADVYYKSRARFGAEVKRRIMIGTFVLSAGYYDAYYVKAQQVRALIRRDYDEAFARVDAIALPTSPTVAFPLGARIGDPIRMYLSDVFTAAANLAGLPAISVPCGLSESLPVGFQLTGRAFDEATLFRAADALERRLPMPRPAVG
jgi:aspartyl-tRNA(Asn)/glutamyl-tRNA(Gln) amidotransferase subunit A